MNDHTQKVRKTISYFTYDLSDIIGCGYSSKVYKGLNTKTNQVVAIKVISLSQLSTPISQSLLKNEIKVLQQINHINLMKVYEIFESKNNTYLVCEYCNQGDLADQLDDESLTETQTLEIFQQITQGIKALHDKKIIHRDIKPANILKHDNVYKLADFGFAVIENQYESIIKKFNVGTPLYMAPETVEHNHYSEQSDIWSLGIVLYQMIYKEFPIKQTQNGDLQKKHQLVITKIKSDTNISQKAKELLLGMLTLEPDKRLKAQDILDILQKDTTKRLLQKSHQNIPCKSIRTIASSEDLTNKIKHELPLESKQIMKSQPDEAAQHNLLYRSQQQMNLVSQQLLSKRNQNYTNLLQNTNGVKNSQPEKKQPIKISSPQIVSDKSPLKIKMSGSEKFNLLVKSSNQTNFPLLPEQSPQPGRLQSQKSFETIETSPPQPLTAKLKAGLVIEYTNEKSSDIEQASIKSSNTQQHNKLTQITSSSNIKQSYISNKIINPNQNLKQQNEVKESNIQQVFTKSIPELVSETEQNTNLNNQLCNDIPQKISYTVEESEWKQCSNQNSTNDTIKHNQLSQCQQITLEKTSGTNYYQLTPNSKPEQLLRNNILVQNKSPIRVVQSQRTITTPPFKQSGINQLRNSQDTQMNVNQSFKNNSPIIHYSSQTKPVQSISNKATSDFLSNQTKFVDQEETLSATIRPTYKFLNFLHLTLKKFDSINTEERQKCYFLLKKLLAIKSKYIFKSCPKNIQDKLQYWIDNFESYYEKVESIFYITPDKTFEQYFNKDITQYCKGFAQLLLYYLQKVNTILLWKELLVIQEILNENLNQFNDSILFARRWENETLGAH